MKWTLGIVAAVAIGLVAVAVIVKLALPAWRRWRDRVADEKWEMALIDAKWEVREDPSTHPMLTIYAERIAKLGTRRKTLNSIEIGQVDMRQADWMVQKDLLIQEAKMWVLKN